MRRILVLSCASLMLLGGCAGALLTTGTQAGMAVAENRSIGRKVDDTVIYTDLTNQFIQADQAALLGKVTFNVRYGRVMLTGNVKTQEDAMKAAELSWKAKGVLEVINELIVNPDMGILDTADDILVKRNLEARYLITKGVWVINYSIDVQGGTAYLIGRVKDQAELDRALNIARTTKGVKRVVSHLQINPDTQNPVDDPNATTNINAVSPPPNTPASSAAPAMNNSGVSDIYTGPVYGGGSITSSDTPAAR
jgi:osmotically-inducible protein OsmY